MYDDEFESSLNHHWSHSSVYSELYPNTVTGRSLPILMSVPESHHARLHYMALGIST